MIALYFAKGQGLVTKKLSNVVALPDDTKTGATSPNPDPINRIVQQLSLNGVAKSTIDHNRFTTLGVTLAVAIFGIVKGMQPTTSDPFSKTPQRVSAAMITSEHDDLVADRKNKIAASKKAVADMQVQVQIAQQKIQQENKELAATVTAVGVVAAPFAGAFAPVVLAATGLIAAGIGADTLRKNGVATTATNDANAQASSNSNTSQGDLDSQFQQTLTTLATALSQNLKK